MTHLRFALRFVAIAIAVIALGPSVALAGSCPVCTSSSMCTSFDDGGVAFCVLHASGVGCGSERMLCCPGQGCSSASGRPSCEGTTCTVVENLVDGGPGATDGGPAGVDSGAGGVDSGPGGVDSGPSGVDSGPSTADGGGTAMDAGGTTPAPTSSGCACRTAASSSDAPWALFGVVGAVLLGRRRASLRR